MLGLLTTVSAQSTLATNSRMKGFNHTRRRVTTARQFRNQRLRFTPHNLQIKAFMDQKPASIGSPEVTTEKSRRTEAYVADVMSSSPVLLKMDMPIKEAVKVLLGSNISGAPVVDKKGNLVGMLSESDLIWKGAGSPQDHFIIPPVLLGFADLLIAWRDNAKIEEELHKILAKTVQEAMTRDPVSVTSSTTMSEAAALMLKKQVNRLPVVEEGKVVGVVTRHDILQGIVNFNSPFL